MIDLHGHYLPAVDDGAVDLEASLAMLRHAEKDGITTAVVTPHVCSSLCKVKDLDALRRCWEKWRASLKKSDHQDRNRIRGRGLFHLGTAADIKRQPRPADHQQRLLFFARISQ